MSEQYFSVFKYDFDKLIKYQEQMASQLAFKKFGNQKILAEDKPGNLLLEISILSIMRDRLKSSTGNNRFINADGKAFVIMTYDEIKKRLHCTGRSCTKALKELKRHGFIDTKRIYSGPTKYYLNAPYHPKKGYYKFYYRYFDEFNNNLKKIYTYMIIRDLAALSVHTTDKKRNNYNFIDQNGKYFVAKNVADICKQLKISLPTGGRIFKELEAEGYIKRKQRRNSTSRIYLLK